MLGFFVLFVAFFLQILQRYVTFRHFSIIALLGSYWPFTLACRELDLS